MGKKINELSEISALTSTCEFIVQDEGMETQVTNKVSLLALLTWIQNGIIFPKSISQILSGNGIAVSIDGSTVTLSAKISDGLDFDKNGNIILKDNGSNDVYIHIRYADNEPTADSDIKAEPSDYMGIYTGTSETAPTTYTSYSWYKIKGENGDTGNGIESIAKTSSVDNVDTYTIKFTNDDTTDFTVTNGTVTVTTAAVNLTGTLSEDNWSDTAPYTQSVEVNGLSAKSAPVLDLIVSDDVETGIEEEKQWMYVTKATVSENKITVQCYQDKPTVTLNFMVKVV